MLSVRCRFHHGLQALVEELDEAQREEFCKSDPSGTFRYNQATRRVSSEETKFDHVISHVVNPP